MGPKHLGLVCTSLSALFIDNGDSDDWHSLISLKLFLGLPIDWTQLEAEAEKPVDSIRAFWFLRQTAGWRMEVSRSPRCSSSRALTGLSFTSEKACCGGAGFAHLTVSPPRAHFPHPFHEPLPRPSQCLA